MIMGENLSSFNPQTIIAWLFGFGIFVIMVQQSLNQIFHTKLWKAIEAKWDDVCSPWFGKDVMDLKPWISIILCVSLTLSMELDLFAFLFQKQFHWYSTVFSGIFAAGGSTGLLNTLKRVNKLKEATVNSKIVALNNNGEQGK